MTPWLAKVPVRAYSRLAGQAFAIVTVVRQLRLAREEGDKLRLLDAAVNALAVLTTILIIVREVREGGDSAGEAVEDAAL